MTGILWFACYLHDVIRNFVFPSTAVARTKSRYDSAAESTCYVTKIQFDHDSSVAGVAQKRHGLAQSNRQTEMSHIDWVWCRSSTPMARSFELVVFDTGRFEYERLRCAYVFAVCAVCRSYIVSCDRKDFCFLYAVFLLSVSHFPRFLFACAYYLCKTCMRAFVLFTFLVHTSTIASVLFNSI